MAVRSLDASLGDDGYQIFVPQTGWGLEASPPRGHFGVIASGVRMPQIAHSAGREAEQAVWMKSMYRRECHS